MNMLALTTEHVQLIGHMVWPVVFLLVYAANFKAFNMLFSVLLERIKSGAEFQVSSLKVGAHPIALPTPKKDETVTENHLALLHSSWRYPKKDKEFKVEMYVIQVIIQANKEVLERIEYVQYSLDSSYPNTLQTRSDASNKFELKELAWGEFNIKATVKVKEQAELIHLSRFINLTETGENLLSSRQA